MRLPPLARRKPFLGSRPRPDALWETLVQAERSEQPGEDIWQQLRTSVADPAARDYVTGLAALKCGDQATARQSFAACLDHHLPLLNPAAYYLYLHLDSGAAAMTRMAACATACHPSELEQLVAHLDKALAALGDKARRQVLHCLANGLPPAEPPTPPSREPPPAAAATPPSRRKRNRSGPRPATPSGSRTDRESKPSFQLDCGTMYETAEERAALFNFTGKYTEADLLNKQATGFGWAGWSRTTSKRNG